MGNKSYLIKGLLRAVYENHRPCLAGAHGVCSSRREIATAVAACCAMRKSARLVLRLDGVSGAARWKMPSASSLYLSWRPGWRRHDAAAEIACIAV